MLQLTQLFIFSLFRLLTLTTLTLTALSLVACDGQQANSIEEIPTKPSNVPSESLWVGGLDGGVFVFLKKSNPSSMPANIGKEKNLEYDAQIHYVSGDLAYQGKLYLYPKNSPEVNINQLESYQGWDGDSLFLSQGRELRIELQ